MTAQVDAHKSAHSRVVVGLLALLLMLFGRAYAHDAITQEARVAHWAALSALTQEIETGTSPTQLARAHFQIGRRLDTIRLLLNEDITSHGSTRGLETGLLVAQLNDSPYKMHVAPRTGLFLAELTPYRQSLALDPVGKHAELARYLIFKHQFYDSFVDDPLKPVGQSAQMLSEMIAAGEKLLGANGAAIDAEEVHFILAIHYRQAIGTSGFSEQLCRTRYEQLMRVFRARWADSLKLLTLEALSPS